MRFVRIVKSADILLKGDGNYAFHNGNPYLITNPPPEAFHPDPKTPDIPLFAHYGAYRPHPSGHPGMGEIIPGSFRRGKHGEMAYHTDGFDHHHGHDGVWHHLGEALEASGQDPALAKQLLQRAIDEYNAAHKDDSGHHHLPDVDSMEWRKIKATPYNANMQSARRPNTSVDGHFTTAFTNRPNRKREKIGTFIESYSIPYYDQLRNIIQEYGLDTIAGTEWATRGHISIDDIHPAGRRLKGTGGDRSDDGNLPDSHITNAPAGVNFDPAFERVQSWSVVHHAPDLMHYKLARQRTAPSETMRSARGHIRQALRAAVDNPDIIPDVMVPINTARTTIDGKGTNYTMKPLKEVLQSEVDLRNLLEELGKTSALTALFGRLKSGGAARPNSGARIFSHLLDAFGGDPDEEGNRTQYDNLMEHALQGEHIELDPEFIVGGKHPTKNGSTHKNMAQMYVKAMLSGAHEDGSSNLRHYRPDPQILRQLGVSHEGIEQENVDARRQAIEGIATMMARAFGHDERRGIPDELPKGGLAGRRITGYPDELISGLPEHVPFFTDLAMTPSAPSTRPTRAPRPPSEPVPRQPPAAAPPPAAPRAGQVGVRTSGGIPLGPMSPQQQAARAGVGQADPATLRQFMQMTGMGPTPGTGALTEQERQFQQSFGNPQQRLLTEYMKSQDNMLPETDRLMKAMENMQRDAALLETRVVKNALPRPVNIADEHGVRHLAKHIGLTPVDVRSIAHQMGDWERIAKRLNVSPDVVKVVKISVGGI